MKNKCRQFSAQFRRVLKLTKEFQRLCLSMNQNILRLAKIKYLIKTILYTIKLELNNSNIDYSRFELLNEYKLHSQSILSIGISPDGQKIATGGADGDFHYLNFTKLPNIIFSNHSILSADKVTFSSDNKYVAFFRDYGNLQIYDQKKYLFKYDENLSCFLGFGLNSDRIIYAPDNQQIIVKNWKTQETVLEFDPIFTTSAKIVDCKCSPDLKQFYIATTNSLAIWDVDQKKNILAQAFPYEVESLSLSPDNQWLAISVKKQEDFGKFELYRTKDLEKVYEFFRPNNDHNLYPSVFTPDSQKFVCPGSKLNISIFDLKNNTKIKELENINDSHITALNTSSDGRYIVSGDTEGKIKIYGIPDEK